MIYVTSGVVCVHLIYDTSGVVCVHLIYDTNGEVCVGVPRYTHLYSVQCTLDIFIYKVVISVCLSVCLSDHNSRTPGPIYLKF